MKWYWWALIAVAIIVIAVWGWNAYQKNKANMSSTAVVPKATVKVADAGNGQKIVTVESNPA